MIDRRVRKGEERERKGIRNRKRGIREGRWIDEGE